MDNHKHSNFNEVELTRKGINFLMSYYKKRLKPGAFNTGLAHLTNSGIVVDGYLTFTDASKGNYLATIESTPTHKKDELKYQLQPKLLFWDSLSIASIVFSLLALYLYYTRSFPFEQLNIFVNLALAGFIYLSFILILRKLLSSKSRYRYIYAIEQFKQYQADDHWVVFDEKLFTNTFDLNFLELKNQCIINGFGLMTITPEGLPRLIIAPAAYPAVSSGQKLNDFLSNKNLRKIIAKNSSTEIVWQKLKSKLKPPLANQAVNVNNLSRFKPKFWKQIGLTTLSISLLVFATLSILNKHGFRLTKVSYYNQDKPLYVNSNPEPKKYYIDSLVYEPHFNYRDNNNKQHTSQEKVSIVDLQEKGIKTEIPIKSNEVISRYDNQFYYYNCVRLFGFKGQKYIVMDGIYLDIISTRKRIIELEKIGIQAQAYWASCLDKAQGYVVFAKDFYNSLKEAEKISKIVRAKKIEAGIDNINTDILIVER